MECMHVLYMFYVRNLILLDIVVWVCIQVRRHSKLLCYTGYLSAAFFIAILLCTVKNEEDNGGVLVWLFADRMK